ncbi:hypothetical protein GCM10007877_09220 [Marinibactrum halimedae]|uniref:Uncharacterized protein n=1 Tax=Marinibactrum halimedae TaxID=1444977 RepID=A0AA37T2G1_9GAMM|nr:hypothetical protein GCM10007877_09220 [Marinibactrum halimedae]
MSEPSPKPIGKVIVINDWRLSKKYFTYFCSQQCVVEFLDLFREMQNDRNQLLKVGEHRIGDSIAIALIKR